MQESLNCARQDELIHHHSCGKALERREFELETLFMII